MPADHRRRFDDKNTGPPFLPDSRQPSPQHSIRRCELRALHRSLQNAELVAERQDLKVENARAALKRCPFEHSAAVLHSPGYEAA